MKRSLFLGLVIGLVTSCQGNLERKAINTPPMTGSIMVGLVGNIEGEKKSSIQQEKPKYILMEVVPDLMKFDLDTFNVKAGEKVILELDNLDGMQHNLVIGQTGSLDKIGKAADAMLTDPKATEKNYVPEIPEVLFATPLVNPGDLYSLEFTAPKEPGYYPYVCTFPGHWRMMNGIMKVEKNG